MCTSDPKPVHIQAMLSDPVGSTEKKKNTTHEDGRGKWWEVGRNLSSGNSCRFDQNTLNACLKFSNSLKKNPTSLLSPSCHCWTGLLSHAPPRVSQPCRGVATSPARLDKVHCGLGRNKEGWGFWGWQLLGKPSVFEEQQPELQSPKLRTIP